MRLENRCAVFRQAFDRQYRRMGVALAYEKWRRHGALRETARQAAEKITVIS
jgi:formate-dependent phosphoribosylglycinamide formyltransferase (GAR transformylase)